MNWVTRRQFLLASATPLLARDGRKDARLRHSFRKPDRNGWIRVRLEGPPADIGYQHGWHLANEIACAQRAIAHGLRHDTERDWAFYRQAAQEVFWPKVEAEYREEIQGIADGVKARGVKLDRWDVVAMNAWLELAPYYLQWHDKHKGLTPAPTVTTADRCSAFVATGSYTRDGRVVMGHNAWTGYMEGSYWNVIFDIRPASGHRILMDGYPGLIHSGDDFGMNSAGILITETTISQFEGFDPEGAPEFVRARKAMQYSTSIDDFERLMKTGNNGGYANTWLVADRKTNEIASLELGLQHVALKRTGDGYFAGSNFPEETLPETRFDPHDAGLSPNARRIRWNQLMTEYRGRIDVAAAQKFLADHTDSVTGKIDPNERTLCGHNDLSPRGMKPWQPEFGAAGAVQAKAADATLAEQMSLTAAMGHPCGIHFRAADYLAKYPQFAWQKGVLRDLRSNPWIRFDSGKS